MYRVLRGTLYDAGNAGGKGDPIMTGFGGRAFEFLGQPGSVYSLVSEKFHKVSCFTSPVQRASFTSVYVSSLHLWTSLQEHWHAYRSAGCNSHHAPCLPGA